MLNPFSQSDATYKVSFNTKYSHVAIWEELVIENSLSISIHEIESQTIDSMPNDIWCFEIYLSQQPEVLLLKEQILDFADNNKILIIGNLIELEKIEDRDWVSFYQSQVKPFEIGNFFISSCLNKDLCPIDKIGIFIESSRAFGTGGHETTAGCVESLEQLAPLKFDTILDIGTGTGILAFVAEKLWVGAKIFACDIEEIAIEIANENIIFNNSKVNFYQNNLEEILLSNNKNIKYNLIISNILARPLIALAGQIQQITEHGGYIILSGFLEYQQESVISVYQNIGFELKQILNKNSWNIVTMQYIPKL
jgi:ribosomal protein L11 methyltransferase